MKKKSPKSHPPKRANQFLHFFLKEDLAEEVRGDLEEQFFKMLQYTSIAKARRNYWYQVLHYIRPFAIRNITSPNLNHLDMYRNYFKTGYRQLWRNKSMALINIGGLAIGMCVAILIGLWVHDEFRFNQHQSNYDRVAQIMQQQTINGNIHTQEVIPYPLSATLREVYGSNFTRLAMSSAPSEHILTQENENLWQRGLYMEADGPYLLDLNMLSGSRSDLAEPGSIIISETLAKVLFNDTNPINQLLKIDNAVTVNVKGVFKDIPTHSTFTGLTFIADWESYVNANDWVRRARDRAIWDHNSYRLFAELSDDVDLEEANQKIKNVKYDRLPEAEKVFEAKIFLNPMKDWHLRSNWEAGVKTGGPIRYVYLFGFIGVFVLILACINFMNLSTARSEKRAKEVGVRKSLGSFRSQLIQQFLSESFLVVLLAFVLAIGLTLWSLPTFNQLADKSIHFPFLQYQFWLLAIPFILLTSFLAGSYPALYLSSFQAIEVLKGSKKTGNAASSFRKGLVILQFTVSVMLIIGTLVVNKQIQYTTDRPLGYDEQGLIMMEMATNDYEGKYHILRDELIKQGAIENMAVSSSPLTNVWNNNGGFNWEGKAPEFNAQLSTIWVSHDFGATVGWKIVEGRDFSRAYTTDSTAYIFNEAAIKYMGLENPIGKTVTWFTGVPHEIIGVVEDMVMDSPFQSVEPAVYIMDYYDNTNFIDLKLNPNKSVKSALAIVKDVFERNIPNVPFTYEFTDETYAMKFAAENRVQKLSSIFALLAIFISCLGLFGLSAFMASQRQKEIGIRKVLGASVFTLWRLLSQEYVMLVAISCLLAIPIAYWGLSNWLNNYEYRTEVSWWFISLACIVALGLTLLTVSVQSIRAARQNPVQSLRSE